MCLTGFYVFQFALIFQDMPQFIISLLAVRVFVTFTRFPFNWSFHSFKRCWGSNSICYLICNARVQLLILMWMLLGHLHVACVASGVCTEWQVWKLQLLSVAIRCAMCFACFLTIEPCVFLFYWFVFSFFLFQHSFNLLTSIPFPPSMFNFWVVFIPFRPLVWLFVVCALWNSFVFFLLCLKKEYYCLLFWLAARPSSPVKGYVYNLHMHMHNLCPLSFFLLLFKFAQQTFI